MRSPPKRKIKKIKKRLDNLIKMMYNKDIENK